MPYRSVLGSQTRPPRKLNPYRSTAGMADKAMRTTMKTTSPRVDNANAEQSVLNARLVASCRRLGACVISPGRGSKRTSEVCVGYDADNPSGMVDRLPGY